MSSKDIRPTFVEDVELEKRVGIAARLLSPNNDECIENIILELAEEIDSVVFFKPEEALEQRVYEKELFYPELKFLVEQIDFLPVEKRMFLGVERSGVEIVNSVKEVRHVQNILESLNTAKPWQINQNGCLVVGESFEEMPVENRGLSYEQVLKRSSEVCFYNEKDCVEIIKLPFYFDGVSEIHIPDVNRKISVDKLIYMRSLPSYKDYEIANTGDMERDGTWIWIGYGRDVASMSNTTIAWWDRVYQKTASKGQRVYSTDATRSGMRMAVSIKLNFED